MSASYRLKPERELSFMDDVAFADFQLRRLNVRIRNRVVSEISERHVDASLNGEAVSVRFTEDDLAALVIEALGWEAVEN